MERLVIRQVRDKAKKDFTYFVENVYAASFDKFVSGDYVRDVAGFLEKNQRTIRVSARGHFKSAGTYAHVMWKILRSEGEIGEDGVYHSYNWDANYFSYQQEMASYHLGGHKDAVKRLIERNPFFIGIRDLKPMAESVLQYTWDNVHIAQVKPQGLLSFKRGLHSDVYVDDPFQDPEDKMNPGIIRKINKTILTQVASIPIKGQEMHVVGTPQTKEDFFFDKEFTYNFAVSVLPAITSFKDRTVIWPEWMTFDDLMAKKRSLRRWFDQEYMCKPVSSELAFFKQEQIEAITYPIKDAEGNIIEPIPKYSLNDTFIKKAPFNYPVIAGLDIGKKRHPSHLTIYEVHGKMWRQVFQVFWDFMDYKVQVERCAELIEHFGIEWMGFDNTRAEFEGFFEQGLLPPEMQPVVLNSKMKASLATLYDEKVSTKNMRLLPDSADEEGRQMRSILSVTNDLAALETPDGHGDAFFSTLCALLWEFEGISGNFSEDANETDDTIAGNIESELF